MSRTKDFYFNEINNIKDIEDLDYQYEMYMQKKEDEAILEFFEKNKEQIEGEKIFNLTGTYPI